MNCRITQWLISFCMYLDIVSDVLINNNDNKDHPCCHCWIIHKMCLYIKLAAKYASTNTKDNFKKCHVCVLSEQIAGKVKWLAHYRACDG